MKTLPLWIFPGCLPLTLFVHWLSTCVIPSSEIILYCDYVIYFPLGSDHIFAALLPKKCTLIIWVEPHYISSRFYPAKKCIVQVRTKGPWTGGPIPNEIWHTHGVYIWTVIHLTLFSRIFWPHCKFLVEPPSFLKNWTKYSKLILPYSLNVCEFSNWKALG